MTSSFNNCFFIATQINRVKRLFLEDSSIAGLMGAVDFKSPSPPKVTYDSELNSFEVDHRCPPFASMVPVLDRVPTPKWEWTKLDHSTSPARLNVVKVSPHVKLSDIYIASSGQPSPPSSIVSFAFSSRSRSSSSRSPESSHNFSTVESPSTVQYLRRQPRIQVSSLLADPFSRTYHLEVIQHPQRTAEFGHNDLSRLPLTPPIIVRLTVRDSSGNSVVPEAELPFLIAHLSLFSGDGLTSLDMGSSIGSAPPLLYGNLVSSIDHLEDLQGNMGLFFIFPDVSIRWRGRFQLGVTVTKISRTDSFGGMGISDHGIVLAETRTRSFDVLPYAQYTAVPRTRLTNSFIRQGARMFNFLSQNI